MIIYPSSSVVSRLPVGLVCRLQIVVLVLVLVNHPPVLRVLQKEDKHGTAGGAGLAELDFDGGKGS